MSSNVTVFNQNWYDICSANPENCVPFNALTDECNPTVAAATVEWYNMLILLGLLVLSGLFSGLNLGLMSLDTIGLEIIMKSDDKVAAKYASALKPIRKFGNFLLCTLLLGNTLVNALLAVFLAQIAGGIVGSLVTTFAIVIMGEIVPQSVCSRHGLAVGYYTRFIVIGFMVVLSPIAYSISWVLDQIMGEEIGSVYNRDQLEQLLVAHSADEHGTLVRDEILIAAGALKFSTTEVQSVMTPIEQVFTLDLNARLDSKLMGKIVEAGYSRVPIVDGGEIITTLLIKDLILLNPEDATPIRSLLGESCCRDPYFATPHMTLDKMLNVFQKGISHMAIIRDVKVVDTGQKQVFHNTGVVTLEDLMEALIQEDIQDETDDINERKDFINNMTRYKSFAMTPGDEHTHVTEKEVSTICKWLSVHYPKAFGVETMTARKVASLVRHSLPLTCAPPEAGEPDQFLWKRGDLVDYCFLVLSDGPVEVISSGQGFSSEVGPWNLLGHQALLSEDPAGYPIDFSIKLIRPVRVLKLSRIPYRIASNQDIELMQQAKTERKLLKANLAHQANEAKVADSKSRVGPEKGILKKKTISFATEPADIQLTIRTIDEEPSESDSDTGGSLIDSGRKDSANAGDVIKKIQNSSRQIRSRSSA